jgi:hypothetical protein
LHGAILITDFDDLHAAFDPKMVDHFWKMTTNGLECLDCEGNEPYEAFQSTSEPVLENI